MAQTQDVSLELEDQLHNLHIFISVAESHSIAQAAEQLFKAPSAVTRSIIVLEHSLGVRLFERKPRGMLLNAYGEAVLVRARRIHEEIQQAASGLVRSKATARSSSLSSISNVLLHGRKLQLLIHLAEYRNISSVAARMNMTQAGASMALSRFEGALGQSLFQRRMQGMVATEAAERLITRARLIFAELRHMVSDISAIAGSIAGSVIIGTTPLGRTHFIPSAIAAAIARHPGVRVSTVESLYDELVGGLQFGDIDIVFSVLRPPHRCPGLVIERLFSDRLTIVVRADHPLLRRAPLKLSDLLSEKWILPRPHALARPQIEAAFQAQGLEPPAPALETGDLAILRHLLEVSDMLAVTSPHQLRFEIDSGSIVELPVALNDTARDVGLIVREGAMLSPAVLAVIESVRTQGREHSTPLPEAN
jgi:LysR family transcriptional regulator, regulator for genes of the gallate degradation pathway